MHSVTQPNLYSVSWFNPVLSPYLSSANILEYFCDLSNPFYDRECNNEVIRMQRLSPEQLVTMVGVEYYLHHCQDSNIFIIRKQLRRSPNQVTPLSYYYIINGTVMQAPDLNRIYNARIHTASFNLNKALKTLSDWARFNSTEGTYSWVNPNESTQNTEAKESDNKSKSSAASIYQIRRIDFLLSEWTKQYPHPNRIIQKTQPPTITQPKPEPPPSVAKTTGRESNVPQPPSKKPKLE